MYHKRCQMNRQITKKTENEAWLYLCLQFKRSSRVRYESLQIKIDVNHFFQLDKFHVWPNSEDNPGSLLVERDPIAIILNLQMKNVISEQYVTDINSEI